jgi:hypothetical protein
VSKAVESAKSPIPTPFDLNGFKKVSLPKKVLSGDPKEMRMVRKFPSKSTMNVVSGKSPLRSRAIGSRLPAQEMAFLSKEESRSGVVNKAFMQKVKAAPKFLSFSVGKERMIRPKTTQLSGQKFSWRSKKTKRLSYVKKLELFRALSRRPSSFLDLHARFGVSKQTIRRLVNNGFLREVWGSNAIGVRFELTDKSKKHLKQLKAAARYDPRMVGKNPIRLKQII